MNIGRPEFFKFIIDTESSETNNEMIIENDDQKKTDTAQRLKYLRIAEEQTLPDEEKISPDVKKRQVNIKII